MILKSFLAVGAAIDFVNYERFFPFDMCFSFVSQIVSCLLRSRQKVLCFAISFLGYRRLGNILISQQHLKNLQSTGAMASSELKIISPSTSMIANKQPEKKFCTISLDDKCQIIESIPILIPQSLDTANDSPGPVLRGSSQQANCDVFRFPPLTSIPQNVAMRFPWIFPLAYCVAFLLLLLSV